MSPYPAQFTREVLINTAWEMVEAEGIDQLSLSKLAAEVGVKAPSLYHHVKNKAELLKAVNELTTQRLFDAIHAALVKADDTPKARMMALAHAYREFAHTYPVTYMLAFSTVQAEARPDSAELEAQVLPLQAIMAEISGEAESLSALRGAQALIHGFVTLELNQQFRRGGDLGAAFTRVVQAYLDGWGAVKPSP